MNKFIILLSLFYVSICTNAQMSVQDSLSLLYQLKMTRYDKDTSADAVVLSDEGSVYILPERMRYDFKNYYIRTVKIKILSEAGISNAAIPFLLFNHGSYGDEFTYFKATTYNLENGQMVATPFLLKDMLEEQNPGVTIEKVAMPNVKVGSVVIISYAIKSPYIVYFDWNFQYDIPVEFSKFNLSIPDFFHYMEVSQNLDTDNYICTVQKDEAHSYAWNNIIHTYIQKNIPAFKDEVFMPSKEDCLMKLSFQLTKWDGSIAGGIAFLTSWQQFTEQLCDGPRFGGYFYAKEHYFDKIADQLNLKGKPEAEKIKTIVNYVKANYEWNHVYSYFADKQIKDFITQKTGNSADINLFLTALFLGARIDATPVLISTREHGKIKINYPLYSSYDDVICYVKTDSISLLLDATEPSLPYYALPPQCINSYGYVVHRNDSSMVDIKTQMSSKIWETILIKIPPSGDSLNCNFTIRAGGYKGYELRNAWNEGYDKFSSLLTGGMELKDSIKEFSLNQPEEPFTIMYPVSLPLIKEGDTAITQVIFSPFLKEPIQDNPLKSGDRKYPVDIIYTHDFKYQSTIIVPEGYKISQLPAETSYSLPGNKASYSYKVRHISDTVIEFTSDLSFNTNVYPPSEYKELQHLYDIAIKKCKEPVILQKG